MWTSVKQWNRMIKKNEFGTKICLKGFIYLFLEGGEGRKRGRETSVQGMHRLAGCLLQASTWAGTKPAIQARALTGCRPSDPLLCRMMPNPLDHTSQGWNQILKSFTKGDLQKVQKHMRKCPTSLVTRKMKTRSTSSYL